MKRRTERHRDEETDGMETLGDTEVNYGKLLGFSSSHKEYEDISRCRQFIIPFQVIEDIIMAVTTNISGLTECLDDASKKFKLYMGYMQRATVQKRNIYELFHYVIIRRRRGLFVSSWNI